MIAERLPSSSHLYDCFYEHKTLCFWELTVPLIDLTTPLKNSSSHFSLPIAHHKGLVFRRFLSVECIFRLFY